MTPEQKAWADQWLGKRTRYYLGTPAPTAGEYVDYKEDSVHEGVYYIVDYPDGRTTDDTYRRYPLRLRGNSPFYEGREQNRTQHRTL